MAKIGVFKPFRGSAISLANVVLEDGEIAFETTNKRIYMGDGTNSISSLTPFINTGNTDISNIGDGSITGAINVLNSKMVGKVIYKAYVPELSQAPTSWTVMTTLPILYADLGESIGTLIISLISVYASGAPTGIAVTVSNETPTVSNSIIFQESGINNLEGTGFRVHSGWGSETFYIWAKWDTPSALQRIFLNVIDL